MLQSVEVYQVDQLGTEVLVMGVDGIEYSHDGNGKSGYEVAVEAINNPIYGPHIEWLGFTNLEDANRFMEYMRSNPNTISVFTPRFNPINN